LSQRSSEGLPSGKPGRWGEDFSVFRRKTLEGRYGSRSRGIERVVVSQSGTPGTGADSNPFNVNNHPGPVRGSNQNE